MSRQPTPMQSLLISAAFVAIVVALLLALDTDKQILQMLQWLESQGLWALLWFVVIMAAVVVLLLPGVLFTMGAGFVFGVIQGTVGVVIGTTLGAIIAFLIARYVISKRTQRFILSHNKLKVLSMQMASQGFKVVLLTRLLPFFPGKLSNYLFGLSKVSLRDFSGASLLGFIPFSIHNVYLGSIAADITTLGSAQSQRSSFEWLIYCVGFVLSIAIVFYLHRLANRLLADNLDSPLTTPVEDKSGDSTCRG